MLRGPAGHLLPPGGRQRLDLGPRPAATDGRGAGRRVPRDGRRGAARPRHQHQALPARRPQLRVLLRGPAARRRAGGRLGQRPAEQDVGASLKHFAVNNQETDRLRVSADVDERTLREIYLPRLRAGRHPGAAVDGDVRLQQGQRRVRLRRTTGCSPRCCATSGASTALVVSDWGAVADRGRRGRRRARPDHAGARRRGRRGPGRGRRGRPPRPGTCSTRAAGRVRALVERARRPDAGRLRPGRSTTTLAREVAGRAIVLLKNDGAACCRWRRRAARRSR